MRGASACILNMTRQLCMKCADVEQATSQRRRPQLVPNTTGGMNTNLGTKEAEIREEKKYKTHLSMKSRVHGVDFTVFKLISELIDQGSEEVEIKREG